MSKRYLLALLLIVGVSAGPAPAQSLVPIDPATVSDGHVYLMDNVGADLPDVSANNNNGNLLGSPQTVPGLNGEALQLNGTSDGAHLPDAATINTSTHQNHTVIAVFNCADVTKTEKQIVYEEGGSTRGVAIYVHEGLAYAGAWNRGDYTPDFPGTWLSAPIGSNEWHVVAAVVRDGGAGQEDGKFEMWMDGALVATGPAGELRSRSDDNAIGNVQAQTRVHNAEVLDAGYWFEGIVDEVWILNQALDESVLSAIGPAKTEAENPMPAHEAIDVLRDGMLSWDPGEFAQTHDVYLGTVFDDVNSASRAAPMDLLLSQGQTGTSYDPGRLEFGQTYYWRVDEVNGAPDSTIFKGETWSFEVEPFAIAVENVIVTASSSDEDADPNSTVNGSGLDADNLHSAEADDMWVSSPTDAQPTIVTYEFDGVYKLHEMLVWNYNVQFEAFLGYGFKDVTVEYTENGIDWIALGDFEFAQATARAGYAANTAVDLAGLAVRGVRLTANSNWGGVFPQFGLSEVRFMAIPVLPRAPQPVDGASEVDVNTTLGWRAGREAGTHDVYFGVDPNALALDGTSTEASYAPGALDLDTVYYWQIVEVNEAEVVAAWEGSTWSFATQEFFVVDDFEGYDNEDNLIYESWLDGWINETGSTVGYLTEPFAETTIVQNGSQAMPLFYDNAGLSTAEVELELSQNWAASGITSLALAFAGAVGNTGQLYVKINGTKVVFDGDEAAIAIPAWQAWNIDLSSVGGNLSSVTSLIIGVEGSGASGTLYVDDIRLYASEPELIIPVEPDPTGLVSHFAFDGDTSDSTGAHSGTPVGAPSFVPGQLGQAISLNGTGDYVDLVGYQGILGANPVTVTAWVKTASTVTGVILGWGPNVATQRFEFRIDAGRLRTEHEGGNVQGDTVINDGTWHHVALTIQANATVSYPDVILWLDGLDDTRVTADPDAFNLTAGPDARIGGRPSVDDRLFMGEIDELYLYDRVLSQAEIAYLAGRRAPIHKPF